MEGGEISGRCTALYSNEDRRGEKQFNKSQEFDELNTFPEKVYDLEGEKSLLNRVREQTAVGAILFDSWCLGPLKQRPSSWRTVH